MVDFQLKKDCFAKIPLSGDSLIVFPIIQKTYLCYIIIMHKMCHTIHMFHFIFRYESLNYGLTINSLLTATL